jgi:phospholipid/cholesterol/gamma-HCH transport system substrate-binding protein
MQFLKTTDPRFHLVETRARWFILMAVLGLLGLVAFVIWKQEFFRPIRRIDLFAASSQGIYKGMAVRLSGFRIGKVGGVKLEGENQVTVSLAVFTEYAHFLRRDSVANVASESLIGDRYIEITAGTAKSEQLKDGDALPLTPEKSIGSLMESLKDEIRPAVTDTRDIISYLNNPAGDFKMTLASLNALTATLSRDVPEILKRANVAAQQGSDLFEQMNKRDASLWQSMEGLEKFSATLNKDFPPLLDSLGKGLDRFEQAGKDTSALMLNGSEVVDELKKMAKEATPEVSKLLNKSEETVKSADEVLSGVKRMWPLRKAVEKPEEKILKPANDE